MAKKICRVYVGKDSVKEDKRNELETEVRCLIKNCLFELLRASNDRMVKDLQDSTKRKQILSRFPEMKQWENPSDSELLELISQEKCDYDGQGG